MGALNLDYLLSALSSLKDTHDALGLYDAGRNDPSLLEAKEAIHSLFFKIWDRAELANIKSQLKGWDRT